MNLIYLGALLPLLGLIAPQAYAESDSTHWNHGYSDGFYWVGSPANACHHHTHAWCDGFNYGYSRGHASNIYYAENTQQIQSSAVSIKGNNNDVVVNQGQLSGDSGGSDGGHGQNPQCRILCGAISIK